MMLRYLAVLPLNLLFSLLCYIVNPVIVLFTDNTGNLPRWLSWFQTQDSGLDQSETFIKEHWPLLTGDSKILKYFQRLAWLYRNAGYGFAYSVCGVDVQAKNLKTLGNPYVNNSTGTTGWRLTYDTTKNVLITPFSLFVAWQWENLPVCFNVYLGWKFHEWDTGHEMLAMRVNPFLSFDKR